MSMLIDDSPPRPSSPNPEGRPRDSASPTDGPTLKPNPYLASKFHSIITSSQQRHDTIIDAIRAVDAKQDSNTAAIDHLTDAISIMDLKLKVLQASMDANADTTTSEVGRIIRHVDDNVIATTHRHVIPGLSKIEKAIDDWHTECGGLIRSVHIDMLNTLRDLWVRAEITLRRNPNSLARLRFRGLPFWSANDKITNLEVLANLAHQYFANNPLAPPPAANEIVSENETIFIFTSYSEMFFFMGRWYYRAACLGPLEVEPVFD